MAEVRIKDIDEHEIDTILADDIDFEGQLTFKKPLMIKGKFKGEIRSESALYVGEKAIVEARIESGLVSSRGRIRGDITGHSRVELSGTSQVDGDIQTPDFVVESGCKFNGHCNMTGQKRAAHTAPGQHQVAAPVQHPQGQQQPHGQPQGQQPHGQPQGQQPHGQPQAQRPPGQPQGQQPQGQPQGQQQGQRLPGPQNAPGPQNQQGGGR